MKTTIISAENDRPLALRLRGDLEAEGVTITEQLEDDAVLIAVLSERGLDDKNVQQTLYQALENYQHVLPVLAEEIDLPRVIGNLEALDFSDRYNAQDVLARLRFLSSPDAPKPLTTLTPNKRAANRNIGIIIGAMALTVFIGGIILVGWGGVQAPAEEFASVETQIFLTRNYFIDEALPRSTEQAANFPATAQQARASVAPFLIETATGIAAGVEASYVPQSTLEATNFDATLRVISTVVRERLEIRATEAAGN